MALRIPLDEHGGLWRVSCVSSKLACNLAALFIIYLPVLSWAVSIFQASCMHSCCSMYHPFIRWSPVFRRAYYTRHNFEDQLDDYYCYCYIPRKRSECNRDAPSVYSAGAVVILILPFFGRQCIRSNRWNMAETFLVAMERAGCPADERLLTQALEASEKAGTADCTIREYL